MPDRSRAHHAGLLLRAATALCVWLALPLMATGESSKAVLSPNATLSGEIAKLKTLPSIIRARACPSRECRFEISTVRLSLSTPTTNKIAVSLTEVIDPRLIIRESDNQTLNDSSTRPLLLRGTATLRHAGASGKTITTPVAATLYLSGKSPTLEISLRTRRSIGSADGFITVRAPLSGHATPSMSARARSLSPYALQEMACGTHTAHRDMITHAKDHSRAPIQAQESYETLYMATDFDPTWMTARGCSSASACNDEIVSLMNQASIFYEESLGITLKIARQYGPTNYSSTTDPSDLLYDFRAHNIDHRSTVIHDGVNADNNLVDLFQLFTGRKMDQKVVGIAFTGVLCDNASSSVAHMVVGNKSAAADPVITAHEIGHTLNASHTTSGIMTAALSAALPSSFSSFSEAEMSAYYSSVRYDCRGGTGPGAPAPTAPGGGSSPTPPPGEETPSPVPETMKLTVSKRGKDSYTIKTTVSSYQRGCFVSVRAGTSEADAETGTVIMRVSPSKETLVKRGRVRASIAPSDPVAETVYLTADYECPGHTLREVSPFITISPNTGAQSSKKVSRRAWINLLNKAF